MGSADQDGVLADAGAANVRRLTSSAAIRQRARTDLITITESLFIGASSFLTGNAAQTDSFHFLTPVISF